jgi:hypothetical protein
VDDAAGRVRLPGGDPETYGGLLRDLDEGYAKRIAIVVPPGAVRPLPAYELALMTAGQAIDTICPAGGGVPARSRAGVSQRRPGDRRTGPPHARGP